MLSNFNIFSEKLSVSNHDSYIFLKEDFNKLDHLYNVANTIIKNAKQIAEETNKPLFILIDDSHYNDTDHQNEFAIRLTALTIANNYCIKNYLAEFGHKDLSFFLHKTTLPSMMCAEYAKDFLKMTLIAADLDKDEYNLAHDQNEITKIREEKMVKTCYEQNEDFIFLVGAKHCKTIFESKILQDKFHILTLTTINDFSLKEEIIYLNPLRIANFFGVESLFGVSTSFIERMDFKKSFHVKQLTLDGINFSLKKYNYLMEQIQLRYQQIKDEITNTIKPGNKPNES